MHFFVSWQNEIMKTILLVAWALILAGSFLPLVHIPLVGNWNYWQIDHVLALVCWVFCLFSLAGIVSGKILLVRFSAVFLILHFTFSIFAIRYQAYRFFDFIPVVSWQKEVSEMVQLSWGWLLEYTGAVALLLLRKK